MLRSDRGSEAVSPRGAIDGCTNDRLAGAVRARLACPLERHRRHRAGDRRVGRHRLRHRHAARGRADRAAAATRQRRGADRARADRRCARAGRAAGDAGEPPAAGRAVAARCRREARRLRLRVRGRQGRPACSHPARDGRRDREARRRVAAQPAGRVGADEPDARRRVATRRRSAGRGRCRRRAGRAGRGGDADGLAGRRLATRGRARRRGADRDHGHAGPARVAAAGPDADDVRLARRPRSGRDPGAAGRRHPGRAGRRHPRRAGWRSRHLQAAEDGQRPPRSAEAEARRLGSGELVPGLPVVAPAVRVHRLAPDPLDRLRDRDVPARSRRGPRSCRPRGRRR